MQLLEINLIQTPQVADAILANGVLTHYDRPRYSFNAALFHACLVTLAACNMLHTHEFLSASVWVKPLCGWRGKPNQLPDVSLCWPHWE